MARMFTHLLGSFRRSSVHPAIPNSIFHFLHPVSTALVSGLDFEVTSRRFCAFREAQHSISMCHSLTCFGRV
jgi:hypothetical protein